MHCMHVGAGTPSTSAAGYNQAYGMRLGAGSPSNIRSRQTYSALRACGRRYPIYIRQVVEEEVEAEELPTEEGVEEVPAAPAAPLTCVFAVICEIWTLLPSLKA